MGGPCFISLSQPKGPWPENVEDPCCTLWSMDPTVRTADTERSLVWKRTISGTLTGTSVLKNHLFQIESDLVLVPAPLSWKHCHCLDLILLKTLDPTRK